MLLVFCLLALPSLPAVASDAAHCGRGAGAKLLHGRGLQAYFAAHRAIEAELGLWQGVRRTDTVGLRP